MKPGVFTQLYVQIVFAVQDRESLLRYKEYNEQIFKYQQYYYQSKKQKIIVNGIEDHIHIFVCWHPAITFLIWLVLSKKVHHHLLMIKCLELNFVQEVVL